VLVLIGIASRWTPALRSLRIEPMTALRPEEHPKAFTTESTDRIVIHGKRGKWQTLDAGGLALYASQELCVLSALCGQVFFRAFPWGMNAVRASRGERSLVNIARLPPSSFALRCPGERLAFQDQ